jgi:LacI family transcriptional regulator
MSITRVAKLAGVSSSTVSRVINNHPRVAPETAEAVRKAMQELSYTPSDRRPGPKPASRLQGAHGANIAFLVIGANRNRATPAFEDLLHGVSRGASQHDLNLVFSHVPDPDELPSRIASQRIDGMLLHGATPGRALRDRLRRIPTVWLMGNRRRPEWGDQVMPDGYEVGDLAAKYLLGRGHRNLAFLNLDANHWPFRVYGHAFGVTAADAGASVHLVEQARAASPDYWGGHSTESVEALVQRYLALDPRPTGVFVADDIQVANLQPMLQRRGVELGPGKVEVISCNNEKPYLVGLHPRPAVIDIRVESIGCRGVEQLLWRLAHTNVTERIITMIEPLLVPSDAEDRPSQLTSETAAADATDA